MRKAADALGDIDDIAWQFLCSPYTNRLYWDWPLDRRIDAYLRHLGRDGAREARAIEQLILCKAATTHRTLLLNDLAHSEMTLAGRPG